MTLRNSWWKILGVVLILYSIVAGLLIPLGSGIVSVTPSRVLAGETRQIEILGYNTHFSEGDVDVWFRLNGQRAVAADKVEVANDHKLKATFVFPKSVPSPDSINVLHLVVHSKIDGPSVLPSALFLIGNDPLSNTDAGWNAQVKEIAGAVSLHFPYRNILKETIRNTYYHVPLWMAMMIIFGISMAQSIRFLRTRSILADQKAVAYASTGILLGLLGIVTGAVWAKNTWGAFWSFDVKQNMAAIALLIYAAYFILRDAVSDRDVARRFAAAYNVFAFILLIPLLFVIPRMTESLHPGSGGNPAFASDDLDNTMRLVFYPAVLGWILFSLWVSNVYWRYLRMAARQ